MQSIARPPITPPTMAPIGAFDPWPASLGAVDVESLGDGVSVDREPVVVDLAPAIVMELNFATALVADALLVPVADAKAEENRLDASELGAPTADPESCTALDTDVPFGREMSMPASLQTCTIPAFVVAVSADEQDRSKQGETLAQAVSMLLQWQTKSVRPRQPSLLKPVTRH